KGNPQKINPLAPVDLIIDHSVQVDYFARGDAFKKNVAREYERNGERYAFLRWGQQGFERFRVVPPGTGICHQVNLEYLAQTIWTEKQGKGKNQTEYAYRSEEHTSELQSHLNLVCRLLLEKNKN